MKVIETHNVALHFSTPGMARNTAKRVIYSLDKDLANDVEVVIGVVEMPDSIRYTPVFVLNSRSAQCKKEITSMGFAVNTN